ncbi:hypothetical protein BJ165DRAFT_679230 [Panaeolus papilionaceus]|nr:hypothetical protein BJ165DRAFT_679230 [Panaeolus papilionaceus]
MKGGHVILPFKNQLVVAWLKFKPGLHDSLVYRCSLSHSHSDVLRFNTIPLHSNLFRLPRPLSLVLFVPLFQFSFLSVDLKLRNCDNPRPRSQPIKYWLTLDLQEVHTPRCCLRRAHPFSQSWSTSYLEVSRENGFNMKFVVIFDGTVTRFVVSLYAPSVADVTFTFQHDFPVLWHELHDVFRVSISSGECEFVAEMCFIVISH